MLNLKQQLPPLNSLITFEAAARHLSFTLAAKELNVTQAAVSRQIKTLECAIDTTLFTRFHRRLVLTQDGHKLLPDVTRALQLLVDSVSDLKQNHDSHRVSISSTIAFTTLKLNQWIMLFQQAHPDIEVRLIASDRDVDLVQDRVDLAIGCGDYGQSNQIRTTFLFADEVFPVCSPQYLADHPDLSQCENLLQHPLLHLDEEHWRHLSWEAIDWQTWFKSQNIELPNKLKGLSMNNYPLLLQAAINGTGVALGWHHLVSDFLHSKQLVKPLDVSLKSQRAYYLVETNQRQSSQVLLLKQWILSCAAREA